MIKAGESNLTGEQSTEQFKKKIKKGERTVKPAPLW